MKQDEGKARWDLLPWDALREIVVVFTDGAAKHGDNGWREILDAKRRYFAAAMRHLCSWKTGEFIDPDSGNLHIIHAAANVMLVAALELEQCGEFGHDADKK